MSLYDAFQDTNFYELLEDYYFLIQKKNSIDVLDIINAQTLLLFNEQVQVDDETEMLKLLGTKEKYTDFDNELKRHAERKLSELESNTEEELNTPDNSEKEQSNEGN